MTVATQRIGSSISFMKFRDTIQENIKEILSREDFVGFFTVQASKEDIWQAYLQGFPKTERQQHNCNACKTFIRGIGKTVALFLNDGVVTRGTIWQCDPQYNAVAEGLHSFLINKPIDHPFVLNEKEAIGGRHGTKDNVSIKHNCIFNHFYSDDLTRFGHSPLSFDGCMSQWIETCKLMRRSLRMSLSAALEIKDLVEANQTAIYRASEHLPLLNSFCQVLSLWNQSPSQDLLWAITYKYGQGLARFKNTAIGTLLEDYSETGDLEGSVRKFESKMEGYQESSINLVTPRMIEQARSILQEKGLLQSIDRCPATVNDVPKRYAYYTKPVVVIPANVFDLMAASTQQAEEKPKGGKPVSLEEFLRQLLPWAEKVELYLDSKHAESLVSLISPVHENAPSLMRWENGFTWAYRSGGADSRLKERVKKAGGKVENTHVNCRLGWNNYDDLDLHLDTPKGTVYYSNKCAGGWSLDVDMNAVSSKCTRTPVENIFMPLESHYGDQECLLRVHQFQQRESQSQGFIVEIAVGLDTYSFDYPENPRKGQFIDIARIVKKGEEISVFDCKTGEKLAPNSTSEMWGLKKGFHEVSLITKSPNYWEDDIGNEHLFIFLEKMQRPDATRGFMNEFIRNDLREQRKVLQMLSQSASVEFGDQPQLSGVGLSLTQKHTFFAKVTKDGKTTLYQVSN